MRVRIYDHIELVPLAMAMARKLTVAMAVKALLLLAVLALFPCAAVADVHASMPALAAHIREIQRLAKTARGEGEVEEPELVGSLGVAEPVGAEDEVPKEDVASQLFAHIREMQQRAAEKLESLNGEDDTETETEGIMEIAEEEEEKEVDPGGVVDTLVQKRFTQLESALKFLNVEDGVEWSADGAQGDDAINLLDQFVRERQQKKRGLDAEEPESQLENDQSHEAFVEHGETGDRNKHGDRDHVHARDHGPGHRQHDHDHGDAHVDAGFSRLSDALHNGQDHGDHSHGDKHRESFKKTKYILSDEEKEADPGGVVDALVQERFNQLEAALKVLNDNDGADSLHWSADGSEGDDAINLLHHFVQERQQKRHQESHLENDQIHEATSVENGKIGLGHRNNHGDREHVGGHDHGHGIRHDHGDADANADFSGVSDAHYRNHDHQHGDSLKKKKFILPEEIAEEEDLLQYGFEGLKYPSAEHLSRSRGPELGVWLRAMGCSLLVSLASLICLVLLPCIVSNGKPSETVVNTLASFGAGAILGDAFLHQLPHAFGNSETPHLQDVCHHDHGHSHPHAHGHDRILSAGQGHAHSLQDLSIGLAVLGGILLFFIVEKIVRRYEELSSNSDQHGRGHSHHHRKKKNKAKKLETPEKIAVVEELVTLENKESSSLETMSSDLKKRKSGKKKVTASVGNVVSTALVQQVETSGAFVIGYLNLFSDAVHNFTDGMALGSAFLLYGTVGGWTRTLFLLTHELPQEVGDFGILVKSGFSVFEALAFNFLSALVALAGTTVALMLGGSLGHSSLIEGFIAGGFIYMSVGGVMPSMHDQGSSLTSTLSQLVPMVFGMAVAIVISLAE